MENVSRRRRREAKKRGVRKSVSVGVCSNALATRSRLSKRTESHSREHLWSLPASLLFFFALLRLPLSLSPSLSLPRLRSRWPSVLLLTCSLTYGSSADRWGSTGRFKGISTIFDSGFHTPGWTQSLQVGEVKITTRHQRRSIVIRRRMWENNRDEYYRSLRGKSVSVVVVTLASSTDDGFTVFRERRYLKKSTRDCMNSPLKMRVAVSFADTHVVWPAKMIRIA